MYFLGRDPHCPRQAPDIPLDFESKKHKDHRKMWANNPPRALPDFHDDPPADLRMLVSQNHTGLAEIRIQKQLGRGKYKKISGVRLQEKPNPQVIPSLDVDDICINIMREIAAEIEESDDPGRYQVILVMGAQPGQRQKMRAIHLDMGGEEQAARAVKTVDEGDLIEMMQSYIGELHQQNVAQNEALTTVIEPLVRENKEMMRIVTDAQKKIAEVEHMRLEHQLREREMDEDRKAREDRERRDHERKMALIEQVKQSGALESMVNMFQKYMNKTMNTVASEVPEQPMAPPPRNQTKQSNFGSRHNNGVNQNTYGVAGQVSHRQNDVTQNTVNSGHHYGQSHQTMPSTAPGTPSVQAHAHPAAETASHSPPTESTHSSPDAAANIISSFLQDFSGKLEEHIEQQHQQEPVQAPLVPPAEPETDPEDAFGEGPLYQAAQLLKYSINEKNQWRVVFRTLDDKQAEIFEDIFAAENDEEIRNLVLKLRGTSWPNLLKLNAMMDGQQGQFVKVLLAALNES